MVAALEDPCWRRVAGPGWVRVPDCANKTEPKNVALVASVKNTVLLSRAGIAGKTCLIA